MEKLKSILREIMLMAAIASIFYGLFCIYRPMAFITVGALIFTIAIPSRKG